MKRHRHPHPEIYCDLNARMTDRHYSLTTNGSVADLKKLGLTSETAVGRRFTFVGGDDGELGVPDDIMFNGVVVHHPTLGYVAEADPDGIYHRSELDDVDS